MYKVERTDYGIKATIRGVLDASDAVSLRDEFVVLLGKQDGPFSLLVDARDLVPPDKEGANLLQECEEVALKAGMHRMAFILQSPVLKALVRQIAHLSGTAEMSKYINCMKLDNADQVALAWVGDGIEPEAISNPIDQQSQFIPLQY